MFGILVADDNIIPFSSGDAGIIFRQEMRLARSNPKNLSHWHFANPAPVRLLHNTEFGVIPEAFQLSGWSGGFLQYSQGGINVGLTPIVREIIEEMRLGRLLQRHAEKGLVMCLFSGLKSLVRENCTPESVWGASGDGCLS